MKYYVNLSYKKPFILCTCLTIFSFQNMLALSIWSSWHDLQHWQSIQLSKLDTCIAFFLTGLESEESVSVSQSVI